MLIFARTSSPSATSPKIVCLLLRLLSVCERSAKVMKKPDVFISGPLLAIATNPGFERGLGYFLISSEKYL